MIVICVPEQFLKKNQWWGHLKTRILGLFKVTEYSK